VLALACLLYVMDLTVLHLAVPAISADLQPTSAQLLWIIDIYGFFVAGMQLSSTIAAGIGVALAVLALVALRNQRPADADGAGEEELVTSSGS
jgi:DHA2 family multidrug resistance protein-like MFS transporter